MGKRKLIIGAVAGALLGVLTMQFDKETRAYTKQKLDGLKDEASNVIANPSETVNKLRGTVDKLNQTVASGTENAINALEQVEGTLDKFINKGE